MPCRRKTSICNQVAKKAHQIEKCEEQKYRSIKMEDLAELEQPNILDEPLHGIYIPSCLFLAGIAITTYLSGALQILLALPIFFAFVGYRAYAAYQRKISIRSDKWSSLELVDQTVVSKNTAIYRFNLKTSFETLDFDPGRHLMVKVPIDGGHEIRYYSPISPNFAKGYFDIMIKSYPEGQVSKYFASLKPGQLVDFKGPVGNFNYTTNSSKSLAIVAGGTGITPILQILNEIITTPEDVTKISLIYANDTENDILLKEELDEMAEKYPYFDVHYVLRTPPDNWSSSIGLITQDLMEGFLPDSSDDNRLLICGPEGMNSSVLAYAKNLGWKVTGEASKGDDQVFVF